MLRKSKSQELLKKIAYYQNLNPKQEEIFLKIFTPEPPLTTKQAAKQLHFAETSILSYLREIYKKFELDSEGGKKRDRRIDLNTILLAKALEQKYLDLNIDTVREEVRTKIKDYMINSFGQIRVLYMNDPIKLSTIYIELNDLKEISANSHQQIKKLSENFKKLDTKNFDCVESEKIEVWKKTKAIDVLADPKYSKLMVLGKLGAGKTTFLKNVAIRCITQDETFITSDGKKILENKIPILISLKDLSYEEKNINLLDFIIEQLKANTEITEEEILLLLNTGNTVILLDALDEVRPENNQDIIIQIKKFSSKFSKNSFVITSRTAANNYVFEAFTEREIVDFDLNQIKQFSEKYWKSSPDKQKKFINELKRNKPIIELAQTPLLLTLLCLRFDEQENFPLNRSELYLQSISILLNKWDNERGVKRVKIDKDWNDQKELDFLKLVAILTFSKNNYLFKLNDINNYIIENENNLSISSYHLNLTVLDFEKIFNISEVQHGLIVKKATGIYAFLHRSFQEYFCARYIIESNNIKELTKKYIVERNWKEIFLLVAEQLSNIDNLLQIISEISLQCVTSDKIIRLIFWATKVTNKSSGDFDDVNKKLVAICLLIPCNYPFRIKLEIEKNRYCEIIQDFNSMLILTLKIIKSYTSKTNINYKFQEDISRSDNPEIKPEFDYDQDFSFILSLYQEIEKLKIFNDEIKISSIVSEIETFKDNEANKNQPSEFYIELNKISIRNFIIENFNYNDLLEIIELNNEEIIELDNYFYLCQLMEECRQIGSKYSPQTWDIIKKKILNYCSDKSDFKRG